MAITTIFSIDTTGISELDLATRAYGRALTEKKSSKSVDRLQRNLEKRVARSIGATLVKGKYGKSEVSDFILDDNSSIIKAIRNRQEVQYAEFKASSRQYKGSKIGQLTVSSARDFAIQGEEGTFTSDSVIDKILGKNSYSSDDKVYLTDLDPKLQNLQSNDITDRVFDFYFKKDPRLKRLFYAKASTMLLNNVYNIEGKTGTRIIGLQIPFNKFNSNLFKAELERKAIVLYINDKFQKELITTIDKSYFAQLSEDTSKPVKRKVSGAKKNIMIDILDVYEGKQFLSAEIINSIKVRPSDSMIIRANKKAFSTKDVDKQPSVIEITKAVQGRTRLRMRRKTNAAISRGLKPSPPNIYERDRTFRESIRAYADFKANTIEYHYENYYDSLERYGYRIEDLVEGSIRSIARQYFNRQFNLVRTNT